MTLACKPEFLVEPILDATGRLGWDVIPTSDVGDDLIEGRVDVVIGSPLEYARSLGVVDFALVPGLGVFTSGFSGLVKLVFRKGLSTITSIATKDPTSSAMFAALTLLSENHEIEPEIFISDANATIDQMLAVADSALVTGDDAIFCQYDATFDVAEEWEDMTNAPLPYLIAWGRIDKVPPAAIDELGLLTTEVPIKLKSFLAADPERDEVAELLDAISRGDIRFELDRAESQPALESFFQYAFFYGVIDEIPAVKFLKEPASS